MAHRTAIVEGLVLLALREAARPLSCIEITNIAGVSDPRGHISRLKRKGHPISSFWDKSRYGTRFKRYFIKK